jgi:hypothetical protein
MTSERARVQRTRLIELEWSLTFDLPLLSARSLIVVQ